MARYQADTWCIFETNLDSMHAPTKQLLYRTLRAQFSHSRFQFGSTAIPARTHYIPGSTLGVTTGSTVGCVIDQGVDAMGRWAYHVLSCRSRMLTVISAYQVCAQPLRSTTSTGGPQNHLFMASAQQYSILRQHDRYLSPRETFVQDLAVFLQQHRAVGSRILLLGDFNEALDATITGMTKLCSDFGLVDLMHQLVGHDWFATFVTGSTPIDYILCDDWVAQAAVSGGYEPFKYRLKGNHHAMVVDFDVTMLFGNATHMLATLPQREFHSKDRKANRQYILAKHRFLTEHHFAARLTALQETWNPEIAESLDRNFQRASVHAAKACTRKPNAAYVRQLAAQEYSFAGVFSIQVMQILSRCFVTFVFLDVNVYCS